jgi:hypothetical protein
MLKKLKKIFSVLQVRMMSKNLSTANIATYRIIIEKEADVEKKEKEEKIAKMARWPLADN